MHIKMIGTVRTRNLRQHHLKDTPTRPLRGNHGHTLTHPKENNRRRCGTLASLFLRLHPTPGRKRGGTLRILLPMTNRRPGSISHRFYFRYLWHGAVRNNTSNIRRRRNGNLYITSNRNTITNTLTRKRISTRSKQRLTNTLRNHTRTTQRNIHIIRSRNTRKKNLLRKILHATR